MLVVVSNDYWGSRAEEICNNAGVPCAVDASSSPKRAIRLILRGSIPLPAVARMAVAERSRPQAKPKTAHVIGSNTQLRDLATRLRETDIVLFRAGLIISGQTLAHLRVRNIHCADIPEFGGLASIYRAIRAGKLNQNATLHVVTDRIDDGEVLDRERYLMRRDNSYVTNEMAAYEAGLTLLGRTLGVTHQTANP